MKLQEKSHINYVTRFSFAAKSTISKIESKQLFLHLFYRATESYNRHRIRQRQQININVNVFLNVMRFGRTQLRVALRALESPSLYSLRLSILLLSLLSLFFLFFLLSALRLTFVGAHLKWNRNISFQL